MQSYYWKGKKEVDVVIKLGPIPIPIEIKYQEHPDDIGGVKEFMNEFDTGIGIVVTKNTLRLDGDILFVALPCFLQFADGCFCFNYEYTIHIPTNRFSCMGDCRLKRMMSEVF
ncbi:MAG: hypothetical protein ACT6FD_02280 [Methanosarcinaceae archaeon]